MEGEEGVSGRSPGRSVLKIKLSSTIVKQVMRETCWLTARVAYWHDRLWRLPYPANFRGANTLNADPSLQISYTPTKTGLPTANVPVLLKPAWSPSCSMASITSAIVVRPKRFINPDQSFLNNGERARSSKGVASRQACVYIPMVLQPPGCWTAAYSSADGLRDRGAPDAAGLAPAGATSPLVSVIIPTCLSDGDSRKCLISLFERTAYDNLEVIRS